MLVPLRLLPLNSKIAVFLTSSTSTLSSTRRYHSPSFDTLVQVQEELKQTTGKGKKSPSPGALKAFSSFFPLSDASTTGKGKSLTEETWRSAIAKTLEKDAQENERLTRGVTSSSSIAGTSIATDFLHPQGLLPIFLASYNSSASRLEVFSASTNSMVGSYSINELKEDFWEKAGLLLGYVSNSSRRFLLLPVVMQKGDRTVLEEPIQLFVAALKSCGIQAIPTVDTLMLEELVATPKSKKSARVFKTPTSLELFSKYWANLRSQLCRAIDDDPLKIINDFITPQYDVFLIHVVRTGGQVLNVSLWNPVLKKRYTAKGMLSDILSCLLQTRSDSMILVPTARADRTILYQCRTAMEKTGKKCMICFATHIDGKFKTLFDSDPLKLWRGMVDAFHSVESNLLYRIYEVTGEASREYFMKRRSEESLKSYVDHHAKKDELPTTTEVEKWMEVLESPQRVAAEENELKNYQRFLIVAYTSTEHTAYCQPKNPNAEENYIIATAMLNTRGQMLEPWTKFEDRNKNGFKCPTLDDIDVLVTYDAKHFLLLSSKDEQIKKFLKRGGRVWCLMLAEYLLDAQRCTTGSNTLPDIALRHGTEVPTEGKIGVKSEALPLHFHRHYLLRALPAMEKVFRSQLKKAQEQSQLLSLAHRMDSLLAMTHVEEHGIAINIQEADRQSSELNNTLKVMDETLSAYVPTEIPVDMREMFDWTSPAHLHALLFGGVITIGESSSCNPRDTKTWSTNLMHLLHRYGQFDRLSEDTQLVRYAELVKLPSMNPNTKLSVRIAKHLETEEKTKEKKFRIILFDVETTGLNPSTDEMIELALYDPVSDKSFCSLIRPTKRITPRTIGIHHITEEAVRKAPLIDAVMKRVLKFLRLDAAHRDPNEILVMVGHGVFRLDEPLLRRALNEHTGDRMLTDGILFCDSLVLLLGLKQNLQRKHGIKQHGKRSSSRKLDRRVLEALNASLRLPKLIESLGIVASGELHRADTDTRALWSVLMDSFGLTERKTEEQCVELLAQAGSSFIKFPSVGCFVPHLRSGVVGSRVTLPGVAQQHIKSAHKLNSLSSQVLCDEVLVKLHGFGVELAGLLLQRQRKERMTCRFLGNKGKGGPSTLHPDGCIRQHIDMTSTVTSRTCSLFPSCQNIAKDETTRRLFISRFGKDGRCVEVDYAQLEIVVLGILSQDAKLLSDLRSGVDFHIKRAEFFSGIPYKKIEEGYRQDIEEYVALRKKAKQFSFQRLYGAGVPLLHKTTGISVKDLQLSIKKEEKEYPGIAEFYRIIRAVALRPNNPGLPSGFIVELPTGCRIHFKTRDVVLNLPPVKNYPIQAYGAELSQLMLGKLWRHFLAKDNYKNRAFITNFVHDSVWLDCHKSVLQECVKDARRIMSSTKEYLPSAIPGVAIDIPLKVTVSSGVDMHKMTNLK